MYLKKEFIFPQRSSLLLRQNIKKLDLKKDMEGIDRTP
jgi:hypothetical protein